MDEWAPVCATCACELPHGARFCPQCGSPLDTGPSPGIVAPRGERLVGASRRLLARVAWTASTLGRRAWARLGLARVLLSSWSRAGRALVRVRTEQHRLEGEHRELISALGWAVYHDDSELADTFKSAARACSDQIERCDRTLQGQVEEARDRVARERLAIQRTAVLAAVESGEPGGDP